MKYCRVCHNISDTDTCQIITNPARDASTVCVVENIRDVMAVEGTQQFHGLSSLGGVISPMDGVGPSDLQIDGGATGSGRWNKRIDIGLEYHDGRRYDNFYIYRKLEKMGVKLSVLARGVSIGDELEYTDEVTLGRSIVNRTVFTGAV